MTPELLAKELTSSLQDLANRVAGSVRSDAVAAKRELTALLASYKDRIETATITLATVPLEDKETHAATLNGYAQAFGLAVVRETENLSENARQQFRSGMLAAVGLAVRIAFTMATVA